MAWTSPRTWLAGEKLTAALLNTHLRDNLLSLGGAWTTYTSTMGSSGGGLVATTTARYRDTNNKREVEIRSTITTLGSAGVYNWTLPSAPVSPAAAWDPLGTGTVVDVSAGTSRAGMVAVYSGASSVSMVGDSGNRVGGLIPFTAAVGDTYSIKASYEWQ